MRRRSPEIPASSMSTCLSTPYLNSSLWSSSHNLISSLCLLNPHPNSSATHICGYKSHASSHSIPPHSTLHFPKDQQCLTSTSLNTKWLLNEMLPAMTLRSENGLLPSAIITAQWKSLSPPYTHSLTLSLPPPHCCLKSLQQETSVFIM